MARAAPRRQAVEATFTALKRVMGAMQWRMRAALADSDLSPPHVFLLRVLQAKGETTPKDLAAALGVSPANVTGLLNKLEDGGLLARRRDTKDRRTVYVTITPKAEATLDELHEAVIHQVSDAFEGWTVEEIEELKAHLDRLSERCC